MDESNNKNLIEMLMNTQENYKFFEKKLQESTENRLWKKINIPCSLHETLNGLTKDEIDRIRKNYDFKNLSALKKAELVVEISGMIPMKFKNTIYALDQGRYGLIKLIIRNSGVITDVDISIFILEALIKYSMIFPGIYNNQKVLFMPEELINIFKQTDGIELESIVRRNTEWIRLTHGLLYYYGVMGEWQVKKKIEEITGENIDFPEFIKVMSIACDFYGQVLSTTNGYMDSRVFDEQQIAHEQRMLPEVDYYPFTKEQLLKAGDPGYVDRTPQMNSFTSFLLEQYRLTDQEINEIASQIINMINSDSSPMVIIKYLHSRLKFQSTKFAQVMAAKIMELYKNTRQWVLKGNTPNELFQREQRFLKPLPAEPIVEIKPNTDVIDPATSTKVGRNDPCPCGSGKKYKKCCGDNKVDMF